MMEAHWEVGCRSTSPDLMGLSFLIHPGIELHLYSVCEEVTYSVSALTTWQSSLCPHPTLPSTPTWTPSPFVNGLTPALGTPVTPFVL